MSWRLRFACGATVPEPDNSFDDSMGHLPGAFCVVRLPDPPRRPIMPDGSAADCSFCPVKRKAKWKHERCFPSDPTRYQALKDADHVTLDMWDWVITCVPKYERIEEPAR